MDQEYVFCANMAHILHDDKLTDMVSHHRPIGRQDKSIEHKCVPADSIIFCIVDMVQETHCQMAALMMVSNAPKCANKVNTGSKQKSEQRSSNALSKFMQF